MATESPANGVSTTLSAAITNTATALSLASATGFPNGQYTCLLSDGTNAELVEASALSGTTLTVTRATETWAGAATAYAFGIGTKVTIVTSVQSVIRLIQSYAPGVALMAGRWYPKVVTDGAWTMNNGQLTALPFIVNEAHTFVAIGINIGTAGTASSARLGVYADNGGTPGALLLDAGTVATTATGAATIAISLALTPGTYWLACVQVAGTANAVCRGAIETEVSPTGYAAAGIADTASTGMLTTASTYTGALPTPFPAANPFQVALVSLKA